MLCLMALSLPPSLPPSSLSLSHSHSLSLSLSLSHSQVERAFEPVVKALFEGTVGKQLTGEEKKRAGLAGDEWAYWLGDAPPRRWLVKDLKPDMEAFALRQRQVLSLSLSVCLSL